MNIPFATLTLGQATGHAIMPSLPLYIPDAQIRHVGLLDGLNAQQVNERYGPTTGDTVLYAPLLDGTHIPLAMACVERGLQRKINYLEEIGCQIILLLCSDTFSHLRTQQAMLLEPEKILSPLITSIVNNQRVGVLLSMPQQAEKWSKILPYTSCFAVVDPYVMDQRPLAMAAQRLLQQGVEVLVLDYLGYHQFHYDFLQANFNVAILLSSLLLVELVAELVL